MNMKRVLKTLINFGKKKQMNFNGIKSGTKFLNRILKNLKGARLNITENCLDRHLDEISDKTAILWEPNNPTEESKKL